jgi:hypothetical protein
VGLVHFIAVCIEVLLTIYKDGTGSVCLSLADTRHVNRDTSIARRSFIILSEPTGSD